MSRKEFLSVKKKYTTGVLFLTAEQGKQTDEDVDDVEVDVESAVDGVVDSLGIDLRLGDIIPYVAREEHDKKPVEGCAGVVEQECGHQLGKDAYNQSNEKGAAHAQEDVGGHQPEEGHGGSDDAGEQQGLGDDGDRDAG